MFCTTFEGIFERSSNPPANPMTRAATSVPKTCDKFGAVFSMFFSTNLNSFVLSSSNFNNRSHASNVKSKSASLNSFPSVVEPVTVTTIIVADGNTDSKSTRMISISFAIFCTTLA